MDPESSHNLVKTIRLGSAEIERVIGEMDDLVSWQTGGYRQANASMPAVRRAVLGVVNNGALTRYEVFIRSIGRRGAAVLHGSFLQALPGCTLMIVTQERKLLTVPVRVRHCELFSGRIHELYLEFGNKMDMETLAGVQAGQGMGHEQSGISEGEDLSGFDDATLQLWNEFRELTEDLRDAVTSPGQVEGAANIAREFVAAWESFKKAEAEASAQPGGSDSNESSGDLEPGADSGDQSQAA